MRTIVRPFAVLISVFLSACATDQLRLDTAASFRDQAKQLVDRGNSYLTGVQDRRRSADIALVASDASCRWGDEVWVRDIWTAPQLGVAPQTLCGPAEANGFHQVLLTPIHASPLIAQLAALTLYQKALTEIVSGNGSAADVSLGDAVAAVTGVSTDLGRLTQSKPLISGAEVGQIKASANLLDTLLKLQDVHDRSEAVRKAVADFDSAAFFASMRRALRKMDGLYDQGSQLRLQSALDRILALEATRSQIASDDPTVFYVARRDLISAIATAKDDQEALHARIAPLEEAITKLETVDGSLRRQLNGGLNDAERKSVALQDGKALIGILGQVAALFPAI